MGLTKVQAQKAKSELLKYDRLLREYGYITKELAERERLDQYQDSTIVELGFQVGTWRDISGRKDTLLDAYTQALKMEKKEFKRMRRQRNVAIIVAAIKLLIFGILPLMR